MPRPMHFEIHAADPERASRFYSSVFGWKIEKWGQADYWIIKTGEPGEPGIDGGLLPRRGPAPGEQAPVNAFPCTIDVPDLDEYLERAKSHGAQPALPKMPVPGVGWLAYVRDTEGNILGMMQHDRGAA